MKQTFKSFFTIDNNYNTNINMYNKKDGIMAVFLFLIYIGLFSLLALLSNTVEFVSSNMTTSLNIMNVLIITITILFVFINKQKISTIGVVGGNWKKSIFIGLFLAFVFFLLNFLMPFLFYGGKLVSFQDFISLLIYYFLVAFSEEIVFRGYIQTRIHGIIKNRMLALLLGALMFTIMHFPFGMVQNNMTFVELGEYIASNYLWCINLFIMHIVWSFVYRISNSLKGSIISHWVSNLAGSIIS